MKLNPIVNFLYLSAAILLLIPIYCDQSSVEVTNTLLQQNDQFITPITIPTQRSLIGNQVPNGFGPKVVRTTHIFQPPTIQECPCAGVMPTQCPPCTDRPSQGVYNQVLAMAQCSCAPKMNCAPCPLLYSAIHEMAVKQAENSIKVQEVLQEKAQEQMRLYAEAQKYAVEMQQEEQKALEASRLMNEAANKAEFARQKMLRATAKAHEIAESTLYGQTNGFVTLAPSFGNRLYPPLQGSGLSFINDRFLGQARFLDNEEKAEKNQMEENMNTPVQKTMENVNNDIPQTN